MIKAMMPSEGQAVIPKSVRERLNLTAGTELTIDVQGEVLWLTGAISNYPDWRTMRSMDAPGECLTKTLMEESDANLAHDNARINKGR